MTAIEYTRLYGAAAAEFRKGYAELRNTARALVELGKKLEAQFSEAKEQVLASLICEATGDIPEEWQDLAAALEEATLPNELEGILLSISDLDESEKLYGKLADLRAALDEAPAEVTVVLGEGEEDEEEIDLKLPGGKR